MTYGFDIVHQVRIKHQAADTLLRLPTEGTDDSNIIDEMPVVPVATRTQKRLQKGQEHAPEQSHIEIERATATNL